MTEKWIPLIEVRGSISDDTIRSALLSGELQLRGCLVEDWNNGNNTFSEPNIISTGTIRHCLRPEYENKIGTDESRLDLVSGILTFDENDVPEPHPPYFRRYIELEVLATQVESLSNANSRRGRPPIYDWDFMRVLLRTKKREMAKSRSIEEIVAFLCEEYRKKHGKAPERTSVRRKLLKDIKELLPLQS